MHGPLFLCVDAGATSVKAALANGKGEIVARGQAGPSNAKTEGIAGCLKRITEAAEAALHAMDAELVNGAVKKGLSSFAGVWLAVAGLGFGGAEMQDFAVHARKTFGLPPGDSSLQVTNDGHLLASAGANIPRITSTIVLIAGTGSVASAFLHTSSGTEYIGSRGGWGYVLGDEGSGYHIGLLAVRRLMAHSDRLHSHALLAAVRPSCSPPPTPLQLFAALHTRLSTQSADDIISRTYTAPPLLSISALSSFETAESQRKLWISECARDVLHFAFDPPDGAVQDGSQRVALDVVNESLRYTVETVLDLVGDGSAIDPESAALALGGSLWSVKGFVNLLRAGLAERGMVFQEVVVVSDAVGAGAKHLSLQRQLGRTIEPSK